MSIKYTDRVLLAEECAMLLIEEFGDGQLGECVLEAARLYEISPWDIMAKVRGQVKM